MCIKSISLKSSIALVSEIKILKGNELLLIFAVVNTSLTDGRLAWRPIYRILWQRKKFFILFIVGGTIPMYMYTALT